MTKTKAVIIGAGIIGTACALELAKAGYEVTLLEQWGLAGAASGGNSGQISLLDRLEKWHIELSMESLEIYKDMMKVYPEIALNQNGGFCLLEEEIDFECAEKAMKEARTLGLCSDIFTGKEKDRWVPYLSEDIKGLLYCEEEGLINPHGTVWTFVKAAKDAGADIREYTRVTGFCRTGNKVTGVVTKDGVIPCDVVICACGAWAKRIGEMLDTDICLPWIKGTAFITQKLPPIFRGQILGRECVPGTPVKVLPDEDGQAVALGIGQNCNGNLSVAQCNEVLDVDDRETSFLGAAKIAKEFLRTFPELKGFEVLRMWSATTPSTPDGNPFFGFLKNGENVLMTAGFKGAFTTAPSIARHVLRTIEHRDEWDISLFDPER